MNIGGYGYRFCAAKPAEGGASGGRPSCRGGPGKILKSCKILNFLLRKGLILLFDYRPIH